MGARVGATSRRTPTVKVATRPGQRQGAPRRGEERKRARRDAHVRIKGGKYAGIFSATRREVRITSRIEARVASPEISKRFSGDRVKVIDPRRFSPRSRAPSRSTLATFYLSPKKT